MSWLPLNCRRSILIAATILALAADSLPPARGQTAVDDNSAPAIGAWKLERVVLSNGKTFEGLVATEAPAEIEFIEVRRPPGKPMYLVVHSIDRKSIESWSRLEAADRAELANRVDGFKNRARIEARRIEDLRLTPISREGTVYWQYQGDWFSLESTADEMMTRRSIVRVEQIFTAYRQILPPRLAARKRLQILIFGDTDRYREFLGGLELDLENPAFFASDFNLVAAGSDLNRFVGQLAKVRQSHQAQRQEYAQLLAATPGRIRDLTERLRKAGLPPEERQKISAAEQRKWRDLAATLESRIKAADRYNAEKFQEVAGQMFSRLNHEAFHAYLENFVYPLSQFDVPRWLNEGLAQTFENGQLEAETLRVDSPDPRRLAHLQADLRSEKPLTLEELLSADANRFLSGHRSSSAGPSRLYLYAWGLCYYLTFDEPLLNTSRLDRYVAAELADESPVERFERLIGSPLPEFEKRWRAAMLALKVARIKED